MYKAKRIDNGEWVTGFFTKKKIENLIVPVIEVYKEWDSGDYMESYEVDGDTLINEDVESLKDYLNTFKYNDDATEHNTLIKQSEIYGAFKTLQWLKNEFRLDIGNAKYDEWRKINNKNK